MDNLHKLLQLNTEKIKDARELRKKSIDDAVSLAGGVSIEKKKYHVLWSKGGYEVGVGKPGKEFGRKNPNKNDMWPYIKRNRAFDERSASFSQIFFELENMANKSPRSLELLGCLLARSAFMLDHEIVNGMVSYNPPELVIKEISKEISQIFGVPLLVFLQYLDAIALNEDVKYQRRLNSSGKPYSKTAGRPNNLLTCAHLIAVLLKRASIVKFASGFAQQRGVSAIGMKQLNSCFPMLDIDKKEAIIISKEVGV